MRTCVILLLSNIEVIGDWGSGAGRSGLGQVVGSVALALLLTLGMRTDVIHNHQEAESKSTTVARNKMKRYCQAQKGGPEEFVLGNTETAAETNRDGYHRRIRKSSSPIQTTMTKSPFGHSAAVP